MLDLLERAYAALPALQGLADPHAPVLLCVSNGEACVLSGSSMELLPSSVLSTR